jgi:hypothetical protein
MFAIPDGVSVTSVCSGPNGLVNITEAKKPLVTGVPDTSRAVHAPTTIPPGVSSSVPCPLYMFPFGDS